MNRFYSLLLPVLFILAAVSGSRAQTASADSAEFYAKRANDMLIRKQYPAARELFQKAVAFGNRSFDVYRHLGVLHSRAGVNDSALFYLTRAAEIDPANAEVQTNIGVAYSELGQSQKAIEHFETAVNLAPSNSLYLTNLGREYAVAGQISQALPVLRQAYELNKINEMVPFHLGNAFATMKQYDSAEVYYLKSEANGGATTDLFYFLGVVQMRLDKLEEARDNMLKVLQLDPEHLEARQSLGRIYMSLGDYDSAIAHYNALLADYPDDQISRVMLGTAYGLSDDTPRADSVLQELFKVDSTLGFQMLRMIGTARKQADEAAGAPPGN